MSERLQPPRPRPPVAVACLQLSPRLAETGHNREMSVAAVASAVARGAEVIVLPELVNSGYCFNSRSEASACAITPDDGLFSEWAGVLPEGAVVIGGFCEAGSDGRLYNSLAVVGRDGVRAVYRKTHLWDREKLWFEPGVEPPPVLDTAVGRIGVLICYDLEFPETSRLLALAGAELIAVPTNWPLLERPKGEHPPEVLAAMAAARCNHVALACCDRSGTERGQKWTAGTVIVDQHGWIVAEPDVSGCAMAEVDLAMSLDKAIGPRNHLLEDRRPELYGALLAATDRQGRGRLRDGPEAG